MTDLTQTILDKIKELEDKLETLKQEEQTVPIPIEAFDAPIKIYYSYVIAIAVNEKQIQILKEILK